MSLPPPLSEFRDRRIRDLAAYWLARRGANPVPGRRDIDPVDIPWALPFIWLCDYLPEERDFRYRLAGEAIYEAHGRNVGGHRLRDVVPPDAHSIVRDRYVAVVEGPAIAHSVGAIYLNIDRPVTGERIILPLSSDGGRVDMILGLTVYQRGTIHPDRATPNKALRVVFTPVEAL
jgi:hypothetical protein